MTKTRGNPVIGRRVLPAVIIVVILAMALALAMVWTGVLGPGSMARPRATGSSAAHSGLDGPAAAEMGGVEQPPARRLCNGATTLEALAECIQAALPASGFAQFAEPGPGIESDWRQTVGDMLEGGCDAQMVPPSLAQIYDLGKLLDEGDGRAYCVLMEAQDAGQNVKAGRGWGTVVVNLHPDRELGIQVPHPADEPGTLQEGFQIFGATGAWYLLLAGAGRSASHQASTCQPAFGQADVTHNVDNLFQATVEEAASVATRRGAELVNLQFHGMAASTCRGVDVLMSYGVEGRSVAGDPLSTLQKSIQADNPDWVVKLSGEAPSCEVEGTLNVQGRLLNGVPSDAVCKVAASRATGRFIHIEQKSAVRDAEHWIQAVQSTFPEIVR